MKYPKKDLCDYRHPLIQAKAEELTGHLILPIRKVEAIFYFVRDEILFGFNRKWDAAKASRVLLEGRGYCNTKANLMVALCRAAGIPARLHCGDIDTEVMHGIFPGIFKPLMPKRASHAWAEVQINGRWEPIDSYINDRPFYLACREKQRITGRTLGYSLACTHKPCSCAFNFGEKGFVHMGAVLSNRGTWEDPGAFIASPYYRPLPWYVRLAYPLIRLWVNRRIRKLRREGTRILAVTKDREREMEVVDSY